MKASEEVARREQFTAGFLIGFVVCFFRMKARTVPRAVDETDPDILLSQAQNQMREAQAKNRERAVQAITQKNTLQAIVRARQNQINALHEKASVARDEGDGERAQMLLAVASSCEEALAAARASLERAITATDQIKVEIQLEDERIRALTARALAMKAQWKHVQIRQSIEEDMLGELERVDLNTDLLERVKMRMDAAEAKRQETRKSVEAKFDQICEKFAREEQKAVQAGNDKRAEAIRAELDSFRQMFSI